MKKFVCGMIALIGLLAFSGQAIAEYKMSPWKNRSGLLGERGKIWRKASVEHVMSDYASISTASISSLSALADKSENIDLTAVTLVDASGPIAALVSQITSTPGLSKKAAAGDNGTFPVIAFVSPPQANAESSHCIVGFTMPDRYSTGLGFLVWASQNEWNEASPYTLDWAIWANASGSQFDIASVPQTGVAMASIGGTDGSYSPTATPTIITLAVNSTAAALLDNAAQCLLEFWVTKPSGVSGTQKFYIHAIEKYYQATQ
jgi:hypothetical protein